MRKNLLQIMLLWLAGIVAGAQFAKFSVTITLIQQTNGLDSVYAGWLLSSLGVFGVIFGATAGVITSRFTPGKLVVLSLLSVALASAAQATFPNSHVMLIIRLLEGIPQILIASAAPTAMLLATPKRYQSLIMSVWGTFFGAAFAIFGSLGPILAKLGGWHAVFYFHSITALTVAGLLFFLGPNNPKMVAPTHSGTKPFRLFITQHKAVYSNKGSLLPGILFGCHTLMYLVFLTYFPVYFHQTYPNETQWYSWLNVALPTLAMIGTFFAGWLANHKTDSPITLLGWAFLLIVTLCLGICCVSSIAEVTFAIMLLILFCAGTIQGLVFICIPHLSDDSTVHAYASGAITQLGNLGSTLGMPIFSSMIISFGWKVTWLYPVICSFLGIVITLICNSTQDQETAEQETQAGEVGITGG